MWLKEAEPDSLHKSVRPGRFKRCIIPSICILISSVTLTRTPVNKPINQTRVGEKGGVKRSRWVESLMQRLSDRVGHKGFCIAKGQKTNSLIAYEDIWWRKLCHVYLFKKNIMQECLLDYVYSFWAVSQELHFKLHFIQVFVKIFYWNNLVHSLAHFMYVNIQL